MRMRYRFLFTFIGLAFLPLFIVLVQSFRLSARVSSVADQEMQKLIETVDETQNNTISADELSLRMDGLMQNVERQVQTNRLVTIITGIVLGLVILVAAFLLNDHLISPFEWMAATASRVFRTLQSMNSNLPLPAKADEMGLMGHTLGTMETQFREMFFDLEKQVDLRTGQLKQRTGQLQAAAQIVREAADVLDVNQLLSEAVRLISERFGYYHTSVYLLDDGGETAVIAASDKSSGGQQLMQAGHRVKVGSEGGHIGWVVEHGEPFISDNVLFDDRFQRNPNLPATRSVAALLLRARGQIIGVMDVHSTALTVFGEQELAILQVLADQLGLAIDNARLLDRSRLALEAERRAYGEISRQEWNEMIHARPEWGLRADESGISRVEGDLKPWMVDAVQKSAPVIYSDGKLSIVSLPVHIRGNVIGVLDFRKSGAGESWSTEEIRLLEQLVEQFGQALENARLYQDTQLRAEREAILSDITSKVRASTNVNVILQTAVRELAEALHVQKSSVQLRMRNGGRLDV